ncbi:MULTISPECIES: protein phosphatase 2C domain-containing protein [Leuconostoc]|uniref:Protein serine/threonine phosphatase PrpC, regulation of stationary phase n=2 Tax=Leuconostoc TaxID=1243 RepID=A0AAN2QVI9_9LACO|nr:MULTISPECIES: protein phosphatase 2C domain-containing protein [Leuconostoc]MBR2277100.1 serine/threonine-protein phosphatase [Leuconostoc sp.]MBZ5944881.1 serine/threonine-protein phosphatase [Leuconostoc gasicomitatum]MBZ5945922.1 serine/threonine-protein phosphatase [Leuconostoc gasicomitatum]MBZ5947905.1 serine/threonine-protein phosphatase [Leuconostoc gasicomitatum]MBZ5949741.1 serine/threonine-protein phosphatase [Leuconostoc gasicomitatum]
MQIAFHTDSGVKRNENQDYVGAFTNQKGNVMVMVADGVTSTEGGEVASAMAVEHFGHAWEKTTIETIKPSIAWIKETVALENDVIIEAGQRFDDLKTMATTLVLAILFDEQVVIGNLGDSKAFLLHHNSLKQISFDHNLKNELVRTGTVSQKQAENVPNANSVTRFLGVDRHADIEIGQHKFSDEDMLFLTSDGITKVLNKTTIKQIMRTATTLDLRAHELIRSANNNGASDNVTALLVSRNNEEDTK